MTNNVAVGRSALAANTVAADNTAVGYIALGSNTTGASNTAVGHTALTANTTRRQQYGCRASSFNNSTRQVIIILVLVQNAGDAITTGANNTLVLVMTQDSIML